MLLLSNQKSREGQMECSHALHDLSPLPKPVGDYVPGPQPDGQDCSWLCALSET